MARGAEIQAAEVLAAAEAVQAGAADREAAVAPVVVVPAAAEDREEAAAEVQDLPREDFFIPRILRRQTFPVSRSIQTQLSLRSAVRRSRRFRILARWRRTGTCSWSLTDLITMV
jgi:hypothetical protein